MWPGWPKNESLDVMPLLKLYILKSQGMLDRSSTAGTEKYFTLTIFQILWSILVYLYIVSYVITTNRVIFSISYWQWKFLPYSSFPCFITSYELDWSLIKKVNSLRYVKWADFSTSRKISIFIFIRTAADIYKLLLSVEGIKESDFGTQGLSLTQLYLYTDFFLKNFYFLCYKTRETWKLEEKIGFFSCMWINSCGS